ncbi:hypothetical protein C0992_002167 [Termitomyces sp. T32_za158]|nr:hypothetical protein C0992_002167 [Termitomyces sp. T32_za158]
MTTFVSSLESLVSSVVPSARDDRNLRDELVSHCHDILTSLATSTKSSASFLPSLVPPPPSRRSKIPSPNGHEPPRTPVSQGTSRAELLKEYRAENGLAQLSEQLLLRDALYLLQGISGKYIRFSSENGLNIDNTLVFVDDLEHIIAAPTKALIHSLSEVGYLYIRVESYVQETEAAAAVGMIKQSLCHHLQAQLTQYYRLIAVLESQMASKTTRSETTISSDDTSRDSNETSTLTLRRLDVWINDWRLRLRMMSVCVEAARGTHGGALVNLIHGYADNGDPFVRKFTDQLLEEVSKPFFATLHKWLFSGELYDPFAEFFVTLDQSMTQAQFAHPSPLAGGIGQPSVDGAFGGNSDDMLGRENGLKLWETKYQFRKEMLPMFVGEAFGRKYSDIAGLERSIDAAYQVASQRLFEVFIGKFRLLDHLSALKNYLLLGHGDFVDRLMEALGPSLARPANTLYRHNLTAHLDTALRSSNAIHDPLDVRRRLDARMLEYSHGEIGWDVFTLEYKVDAPIDTVLDPVSMETYLKLFRHLWQMKRIEIALNAGWLRTVGGTRNFLRVPGMGLVQSSLNSHSLGCKELEIEWHKVRIVMTEMIHFIRQMQAHCHLEVIECSWKVLTDFLNKKEGDLDALLDAHQTYLDRMARKVLLLSSKTGKEEVILSQVKEIFSTILQYREAVMFWQDNFYNYCLTESSRRDEELDAQRGVYTGHVRHDKPSKDSPLPGLLERLGEYGSSFTERAQTIVHHLQVHSDLDSRFLGVRLSFSDFYKSRKELAQTAQKSGS